MTELTLFASGRFLDAPRLSHRARPVTLSPALELAPLAFWFGCKAPSRG